MKRTLLAFSLIAMGLQAAAAKDIVVKIGHAGPLTGPAAAFGKDGENGARLAIENANAKGLKIGNDNVKFELVSEDDQADPRMATTVAQRLTDAGVKGIIGRALLARPKVLLLDEPSMGLAPLVVEKIFEVIHAITQEGMTVLLVEQNANLALEVSDRAYVMDGGRITLSGSGQALLTDPKVRSAYLGESEEAA